MKANKAERDLSVWLDGEAGARGDKAIREAVGASPALEETQAQFKVIGDLLREEPVPAGQTGEAAWSDVQRRMRLAASDPAAAESSGVFASRLRWVAAMMLMFFVGLAGLWIGRSAFDRAPALAASAAGDVEWVETDVKNADTMVYWDEETDLTVIWLIVDEAAEGDNADS